jgi:uncharacterized protein
MVSYTRPGVYVEETLRTRNPDAAASASAAVFIAPHGRGPDDPHLVRSWSDFSRVYGGFPSATSLLPYAVFQFFNNGGREAYVIRVTGNAPATSFASFNDRGDVTSEPTLNIEAHNAGAWGDNLYIGISEGATTTSPATATFDLTVYFGGNQRQNIVERFTDLSMDPESPRYVESVVNSILTGSSFITAHDVESSNLDLDDPNPYDEVRPGATGGTPTQLDGGDNGAAPVAADLTDALDKLESLNRTYVLNYPGVSDDVVINAAITHVSGSGRGFVVVDPPADLTPAAAVTYAETLQSSSHAAVYYPHIHIADPGMGTQGATRLVPPGGAVCGLIAATDATRGTWKAPAGLSANLSGAVNTATRLTSDDLDLLNAGHVNAIRHAPGAGFVIWGARTRKKTQADKYIPIRRTLIHLKKALEDNTEWAVFEPNDTVLWNTLQSTIEGYLNGVWQQGGLRGESPAEAFYVKADSEINTTSSIEAGVVNVEVGVALQYPAEFIIIKLSQWEGGASTLDSASA